MADTKITALAAITTVDPAADVLPIVDISDTSMAASGTTKKITSNQILGAGGTATLASATITGDLTAARLNVTASTIPANGVYLVTTNKLGLSTNSIERLNIDSTGNLTNLTTTTQNGFVLFNNTIDGGNLGYVGNPRAFITGGATSSIGIRGESSVQFSIAANLGMTLNSTGLGIGNSPNAALDLTNTGVTAQREIRIENSTVRAFVGVEGTSGNKFVGSATNNAYFGTASTFGLEFATNNNVRMLIDTSGNVGVGVTPSAWGGVTAGTIQTFAGATLYSYGTDNFNLAQNAFYNTVGGASDKYIRNGSATKYYQANGDHQWLVAPSGTAGNAISFTNALTLDANSNLVLGSGAVATTATNGFLYVTSCAGTPTGTPTAKTGRVPIVVDTTNNKLYFYSGGSWVAAN